MKKNNRKGFTIVELVIVIAVIAILASVLIPTFSNVIDKANESAAKQEANAIYKEAYAVDLSDGKLDGLTDAQKASITSKTFTYDDDGSFSIVINGYTVAYSNGTWTATKNS